jgi:hypothetical protein
MSYSFLKESKLYIVYSGSRYRIHTSSAVSFSQTFASDSYSVKTLHDQSKMFEGAKITKANPANFELDVPLTKEKDESIIIDLLSDLNATTHLLKSFDIYLQTNQSTFKLENAIITGGAIDFGRNNPLTIRLQGEGTKYSKISPNSVTAGAFVIDSKYKITSAGNTSFTGIGAANNNVGTEFTATGVGSGTGTASYVIPGSVISESATRTPLMVYPVVSVDSLDMNNITSVTVNIQNNIDWAPFETLQSSLAVTNSSNVMRASDYTVSKRVISGAISQYQTDNNINQFDNFSTSANITLKGIKVEDAANATPFIQLALTQATYTARMNVAEVYMQSYDFSYTGTDTLGTIITQYTHS